MAQTMKEDWAALSQLAAVKRDMAMGKLATLRAECSALEDRIEAAHREAKAQLISLEYGASANLEKWQQWSRRNIERLNIELAQLKAREAELTRAVAEATGRANVIEQLADQARDT